METNRMHRFQAPERSNFRAHAHSVSDNPSRMKLLLSGSDWRVRGFSWAGATGFLQSPGIRARNGWRSKAGGGLNSDKFARCGFRVAQVPPALTASRDQ
jgi:hypothetical protein